jgi:hypothetical protein
MEYLGDLLLMVFARLVRCLFTSLVSTIEIRCPGCNTVAVACYAAAGFTFGTIIAAPAAPAAIIACNAALGTCSAACAATALLAPTP